MNTYYFLTSESVKPDANPGSHFISDGIKALVHTADPEAVLQDLTLFSYKKSCWSAILDTAKGIFLCGNPRFDLSDDPVFWLTELLDHMLSAQTSGIKIGDLYLGAACPLPYINASISVKDLMQFKRNEATLKKLSKFDLVVTRDEIAQKMCLQRMEAPLFLADSTIYAKDYLGVAAKPKEFHCVTLPSLNCTPLLIKKLYEFKKQLSQDKKTYFLCHCKNEYHLAKSVIKNIEDLIIIYDPKSLLEFYSKVDRLISCRLHGSAPALSLGAQVANIAMDTRALSFDNLGMTSTPYIKLPNSEENLIFNQHPDIGGFLAIAFVNSFKEKIMR